MPIEKHINLNQGCFLNPANKQIVVNLASEDILNLITQELKTRYSPETQKNLLEESSKLLPSFVFQELLQRQQQVVDINPDSLIVVSCQIAEAEVDDLGFDLNVEVYFVVGDTKGQNHFRANQIVLWSNIWGDEEQPFDLEDELGEQFWTSYQIQLLFDEKEQQTIELELSQTDDYAARLEFSPSLTKFSPSIVPFTDNDF
ncbi:MULTISPECIES: hypothetical protein [unclassified Nostoc]|uniref:hypothetical protein n=1 Tax=unclassified Nostoc TaxID=2593658 RepID=UPI0025AA6702|nr:MULTISPECIES: hypothetical protein [unclassified Nostoc]MDM9586348.1 hypothetical protein [Nostoc sp. GT001]MDZ7945972.1 hypothetical protein [Nostoc sp. EfeVER01]MDZ7990735.1 hypothetical protein [Nostoc sp. EspVER01]